MGDVCHGRAQFRLARARERAALITELLVVCYVVLSALSWAVSTDLKLIGRLPDVLSVLAILVGGWLVARPWVPDAWVPWITAMVAVILVELQLWQSWHDPANLGLLYALVLMVAYGSFTFAVPATLTAAVPMLVGYGIVAARVDPARSAELDAVAVAALTVGTVLLVLRLKATDSLAASIDVAQSQAMQDGLTGLPNRQGLHNHASRLVAYAAGQHETLVVVFVDVDGLKAVNDAHGHDAGDRILILVACALQESVREADVVGRWGGDEFVILATGTGSYPAALTDRITGAVRDAAQQVDTWAGTVSIGTAVARAHECDWRELITRADLDMYQQRHLGRSAD